MDFMRRFAAVLVLSACSANTQIASNTVAGPLTPPPPGTAVLAGAATVTVVSASGAAAVAGAVVLGAIFNYAEAPLDRTPPPMDEQRRVNEHDCTKPVTDYSANLRCR
jgi:hypothetical protein